MRVLVAAVSSSSRPDGVARHSVNLAQSLVHHANVDRVDLAVGAWQRESFLSLLSAKDDRIGLSIVRIGNNAPSRNRWYWSHLPRLAIALGSHIVHVAYPVPVHKQAIPCPVVASLHDMYPYDIPENFGYPRVFMNRLILQQCLSSVDGIACVSDSTMHRLEVHLPTSIAQKAWTIYNSVDARQPTGTKSPFGAWHAEPFLLCVAQHRRNKNLPLALQVLRSLLDSADIPQSTRLVIVGADGPETPGIKRIIRRAGLEANVLLFQGVSDEVLNWYYSHCELLIAPSSIEGFGLPIVEAMLHRCRVVCSDIPAFREIGGTYCDYVALDSDPVAAFAEAIRTSLKDKKFRAAQIERFSAANAGHGYLKLYNGLLQAVERHLTGGHQHPARTLERGHP